MTAPDLTTPASDPAAPARAVTGPACYLNRELSWLAFNRRVLEEAADETNPLLERLRFLAITSTNLDEFFEVRIAGLKRQIEASVGELSIDGMSARRQLEGIEQAVRKFTSDQYDTWNNKLQPALAQAGIRILSGAELSQDQKAWAEKYFDDFAVAVLTPLAIDPAHPFPQLLSKSLNLAIMLKPAGKRGAANRLAIVQIPRVLPRLVRLPSEAITKDYILQKELTRLYLEKLFPGHQVIDGYPFRVTRNADFDVTEDEAGDLLETIEAKLRRRRKAEAVRLEVTSRMPADIVEKLAGKLGLSRSDVYICNGPVNLGRLVELVDLEDRPDLKWPPYTAINPIPAAEPEEVFERLFTSDLLLHHPFESFEPVVEFLEAAVADPAVLAIKMTLYRTSGDSPVVRALMSAAEAGKQVTVLVELKARFDEENNIRWARALEEQGVHVVYGLVGLKTHCKVILVVRREDEGVRRYCHLGTGNYNPNTARLYTDLGLFTSNEEIGRDVSDLFNLLTGYAQPGSMRKLLVAPFSLHENIITKIRRETANARGGKRARIIAKMNALVDRGVIDALYEASCAGVRIELIVRGICCLRPGMPGLSENISVRSIVDRFLEHSRIFVFENGGEREVYLGSADWMPRNFFGRIEAVFPVLDAALRARIVDELLMTYLKDDVRARILQPDGSWARTAPLPGSEGLRAQTELLKIARTRSASAPAPIAKPRKHPARKNNRVAEFSSDN
ncbi:MAG: polyphosphate kinase 1 [Planctomycetes bacterium]|nr:polyphosphate kinase 1 [Planctomycetota bacterium]